MSTAIPVERVIWNLWCPFPRIRVSAEFSFAEKKWNTNERLTKVRGSEYVTKRYAQPQPVLSLYVGTDDYLTIKHTDATNDQSDNSGRASLGYGHIRRFVEGMEEMLDLAGNGCYEDVDGGLFTLTEKGKSEDSTILIEDFFQGASIGFEPCIILRRGEEGDGEDGTMEAADIGEPGVRMFVNSWSMSSEASLEDFANFVHYYTRLDMFQLSQSAVGVYIAQTGGVPGVIMEKTAAAQPVRVQTVGLSGQRPILAGARKIIGGKK